jgi:nucleoside-diphosphate-sugar epimerase
MNVLVTGHNGFIGRAVTHELVARGHTVRLFAGDVREDDAVKRQVKFSDVVIHLAAKTPGGPPDAGADFEYLVDHNLSGSIKVAVACEERDVPMLYAATRLITGNYGRSKAMAEKVCVEEYGAIPVRVSMAYGPGQEPPPPFGLGKRRLIPTWVCQALSPEHGFWITGSPSAVPDLVYIDDVADAYADLVEVARPGRQGIEVAGPGHHSLMEVAEFVADEVKRQMGYRPHTWQVPGVDADPPAGPSLPGGTTLRVGLRSTVLYYRSKLGR